jgi:type I restriction enzyme S subunit
MKKTSKKPEIRFTGFEDEWAKKKFDDVFDFLSNNTLSRDTLNSESGVAKNIHYGDVLTKFGEYVDVSSEELPFIGDPDIATKFIRSHLKDGDIVIADTAEDETVGKCTEVIGVEGMPVIAGLHTMPCRPKEKYAPKYMGYYLNSNAYHDNLFPLMQGVKVTSISRTGVKETEVILSTEFDEQEKIGKHLSSLDDMIDLETAKHEKLVIIKKAMLEKMFPKNGRNVPEIRFAGFTEAWEQRKAKDLFVSTADKGHPELPVLSATQDRGMVRRDENSINIYHDKKNEDSYKRVLPGQFVIHLRSFQGGFAHSILEGITSPAYTIFGFSEPDEHDDNFWKYIFNSKEFIRRLETVTYGIRDGRSISYDEFLTMSFTYPSKAEQSKIASYFDNFDHLITLHQRKLEKLKNIKSACMEKMFV